MSKRNNREQGEFTSYLEASAGEAREPGLYPEGPWLLRFLGFTEGDAESPRTGDKQHFFNLRYEGFEPLPEVDQEEVEKHDYEGRVLWVKRYVSSPVSKAFHDGSMRKFLRFMGLHGVDTADDRPIKDIMKAAEGQIVLANLSRYSYENKEGETIWDNRVSDIAAAS